MARPTKTLQEHLRDGSFRADRHAGLLFGPFVDDVELAGLQATYRTAASTDEQRLIAIAFAQQAKLHEGRKPRPILNGRDGAAVADFFASNFVHTKGPAAGRAVRARGLAARLRGRVLPPRRGGQAHLSPRRPRSAEGKREEPAGGRARPLRAPDPARLPGRLLRRRLEGAGAHRLQLRAELRRDRPAPRRRPRGPKRAHLSRRQRLDAGRLRRRVAPVRALASVARSSTRRTSSPRRSTRTCGRRSRRPCTSGSTRSSWPSRRPGRTARACSGAWSSPRSPSSRSSAPTTGSRSDATRKTACSSGGTPPRTRPSWTTRRPGVRPTPRAGSTCATFAGSETHRGRPSRPSAACT